MLPYMARHATTLARPLKMAQSGVNSAALAYFAALPVLPMAATFLQSTRPQPMAVVSLLSISAASIMFRPASSGGRRSPPRLRCSSPATITPWLVPFVVSTTGANLRKRGRRRTAPGAKPTTRVRAQSQGIAPCRDPLDTPGLHASGISDTASNRGNTLLGKGTVHNSHIVSNP